MNNIKHLKQVSRPSVPRIPRPSYQPSSLSRAQSNPVHAIKFVINKMDTFVHAGNAQLIVSHTKNYRGTIKMYVLRGERQMVQMNADSIWGAEIRNGEVVLYEFFGPEPDEEFVRDLVKATNKYSQMDKLGS